MKLLQNNPELRQSIEHSLRKNNILANRMQKVGVSPLRQKQQNIATPKSNLIDMNYSNDKLIEDLVANMNRPSNPEVKGSPALNFNKLVRARQESPNKDQNMHSELDEIQMLLMSSQSPAKQNL